MGDFKGPRLVNAEYIVQLRKSYPEICEGKDDDEVMNYYNPARCKYVECTLWDHLGDAAYDYNKLADAYLKLLAQEK